MLKKLLFIGAITPCFLFSQETQKKEAKISIMPSFGYAWRLAELPSGIPEDTRDYIRGLKTGINFDISAYYHLRGNSAIGLKYSNYIASSDGRLTVEDENGNQVSGFVSTKDNISFIGPAYMFSNFKEDSQHKFFYDIALGVLTYTTKTGSVKGTGSNLGLDANIGYQYAVSRQFFIGPKIGFVAGTLTKMKFNGTTVDLGEDAKEGLTRVSLSAAATFSF